MKKYDFAYYLTDFLSVYLPRHRNASQNTILSYRDTFSQILRYCKDERGIAPEKFRVDMFDAKFVRDFLLWLEVSGGASPTTCNQRLSCIRSFYRYLQIEAPEHLAISAAVLSLESKRRAKPLVKYLTHDEILLLLAQPDVNTWNGRRDTALLSLLYDAGARVQEICDVTVGDLRTNVPATVKLTGKGCKTRIVPLSGSVAEMLAQYVSERNLAAPGNAVQPLFTNRQGGKLTRGGVSYILAKYLGKANSDTPNALPSGVTPHCLRHSKAMHMLESGINLIYIRDFLGHEDVKTTQVYAKANPEVKRNAIVSAHHDDTAPKLPAWQNYPDLMRFLKGMGR